MYIYVQYYRYTRNMIDRIIIYLFGKIINTLKMAGFRNVWNVLILRRNVVGIMAFLGFINVYSLRVNLSVAIVAMTQNRTIQLPDGNVTMVSIVYTSSALAHSRTKIIFSYNGRL